jgi:hypothetical protein
MAVGVDRVVCKLPDGTEIVTTADECHRLQGNVRRTDPN